MLLKGMGKGNLEKSCVFSNIKQQSKFIGTVGKKPFDTFFVIVVVAFSVTLDV